MPRFSPRFFTPAFLVCLIACLYAESPAAPPEPARIDIPADTNALERWRTRFESLDAIDPALSHRLTDLGSPIGHETLDTDVTERLRELAPLIDTFTLRAGEVLLFPPIHGPETPFPDHAPLAQIARLRCALIKLAWLDGDAARARELARENLALARAVLTAQEGIIPVITASALWQTALDGVYWLARRPGLATADAAALQGLLATDHDLAARALARAFQGEYDFVQKVVIERLPQTHDPELILSAIGSLGMAPPVAPDPGELRLPITDRPPLDVAATLAGSVAEVRHYLDAFATRPSHHPRSVHPDLLAPARAQLAGELGAFLHYAVTEEPPTAESIAAAAEVLARVDNAAGKLYLLIATPYWNAVSETVYRRQAQSNALQGLLAWRQHGRPAGWEELTAAGLLAAAPDDPFDSGALRMDATEGAARIWSVGMDGADEGGAGDGENIGRPDDLAWPAGL